MRQIPKVLARRVVVAAVIATLAVPFAGANTLERRDPGFDRFRPRLIKVVKKIVRSLGDLLSNPRP